MSSIFYLLTKTKKNYGLHLKGFKFLNYAKMNIHLNASFQNKKFAYLKLFTLLLLSMQLVCVAQTKIIVKHIYPFFTKQLPGNIRADQNGKPYPVKIDTTIILYVETTSQTVQWQRAYWQGMVYEIAAELIVVTPFNAGKLKDHNQQVTLYAGKANFLWQLYLAPITNQKIPSTFNKQTAPNNNEKGFFIQGKNKGKLFIKMVDVPIELSGTPAV